MQAPDPDYRLALELLSAVVGLMVGSFLATVVLRLPKNLPIVLDRSACPHCGRTLTPIELIPVVSWIVLRRRCRACGGPISAFYPVVELLSALVAVASVHWMPWPGAIVACLAGWCVLVVGGLVIRKWVPGSAGPGAQI
jgi:leader peptidase (prepilin peptidase)/N-methyltransferase